ncbi:hypothetical protein BU15DRAFT_62628 [Melanogaster broomeanus]|nr:hypothetical protein BU15DRAFT_62628 [Melanogaster broomeanus]
MGKVITSVAASTKANIDIAAQAAQKACKTSWGLQVPGEERERLICCPGGRAFRTAHGRGNKGGIAVVEHYAGWADRINGKVIEVCCRQTNDKKLSYTRHEPIGVVVHFSPWSTTFLLTNLQRAKSSLGTYRASIRSPRYMSAAHHASITVFSLSLKIVPALATGKSSTDTAPQPATPSPGTPSSAKSRSPEATLTGDKIMEAAARSILRPVTLELGGKSPTVVFDDVDLDQAVKWGIHGIYFNHGQSCCAGSRIFVQEGFTEQTLAIKVGDPFAGDTYQGPQVSEIQLNLCTTSFLHHLFTDHRSQYPTLRPRNLAMHSTQRIIGYIESRKTAGGMIHLGGVVHRQRRILHPAYVLH